MLAFLSAIGLNTSCFPATQTQLEQIFFNVDLMALTTVNTNVGVKIMIDFDGNAKILLVHSLNT